MQYHDWFRGYYPAKFLCYDDSEKIRASVMWLKGKLSLEYESSGLNVKTHIYRKVLEYKEGECVWQYHDWCKRWFPATFGGYDAERRTASVDWVEGYVLQVSYSQTGLNVETHMVPRAETPKTKIFNGEDP